MLVSVLAGSRLCAVLAACFVTVALWGCAESEEPVVGTGPSDVHTTSGDVPATAAQTTVAPTTTEQAQPVDEWAPADEISAVLTKIARAHPDAIVYAPTSLPKGTVVAEGWWPVASSEEPPAESEWEENPRIIVGDPQAEIRLVLEAGDAWIELLEGVQGDLGNLPGEDKAVVAGREASVHGMLGGTAVQWSHGGIWFAVFGRGMAREDVVRTAEGMVVLSEGAAWPEGVPE